MNFFLLLKGFGSMKNLASNYYLQQIDEKPKAFNKQLTSSPLKDASNASKILLNYSPLKKSASYTKDNQESSISNQNLNSSDNARVSCKKIFFCIIVAKN